MASVRKSVLITGCSLGGIGDALARRYHQEGLQVFATSRTLESMKHLQALGITTMVMDVTNLEAIRKVKAQIAELTRGSLNILVNNAGQAYTVAATDFDMADVRKLFEVHIFAPMTLVQEFIHMLIASQDGRIVNIGSLAGICPLPFGGAYNASKAALNAYGNTIRIELAPFGIKVLTVITGAVKTNIVKPRTLPPDSLYKPMEKLYQERRLNMSQQGAMDPDPYAVDVVRESLSQNPSAYFWAGNRTTLVWLLETFGGRRAFDWWFTKMYGIDQFSAMLQQEKSKNV